MSCAIVAPVFPGFGTVVNVGTVIVGAGLGLLLGHRLPVRTRETVTDALGLVTLLIGALVGPCGASRRTWGRGGDQRAGADRLGSLLLGGIAGSLVDIESQLDRLGDWLRRRLSRSAAEDGDHEARQRFIEGFVTASLVFCVGPLTILGALSDGLGLGAEQPLLKAALDGFASIAFAASLGVGVMAAALAVAVIQGTLTLVGFLVGDFLPTAQLAAVTACGGLLLLGVRCGCWGSSRFRWATCCLRCWWRPCW